MSLMWKETEVANKTRSLIVKSVLLITHKVEGMNIIKM